MATLVNGKVKLSNGKIINPVEGEWYESQHYLQGSLSAPGVINDKAGVPGAGQAVSPTVVAATNKAAGLKPGTNEAYIASQQKTFTPQAVQPSVSGGTGSTGSVGTGSGTGVGIGATTTPTIDLQGAYQQLYANSGITQQEADLMAKDKQYLEAKNKISDNPFLDAATMDKRLQRLKGVYEAETTPIRNNIAVKKADVETQLNLQTKQFDINSQAAKDELNKFNTLLSMGALNNASSEDIANLVRSTGISSQAIMSAIDASKQKNVKTQVITETDDQGNVTASVVDSNSGQLINQVNLGNVGKATKTASGGGTSGQTEKQLQPTVIDAINQSKGSDGYISGPVWKAALEWWINEGGQAKNFLAQFKQYQNPSYPQDYQ